MYKSFFLLFLLSWFFTSVASANLQAPSPTPTAQFNEPSLQETFKKVGQLFDTSMLQCPARVWPNYDWKNYTVLFLEAGKPTMAWRGRPQSNTTPLVEFPEAQVPEVAKTSYFTFLKLAFGDASAIQPSLEGYGKSDTSIFDMVVHEAFHQLGQKDWKRKAAGFRGTSVPLKSAPRIYRRMLYQRLDDFFMSNGENKKALGQAAYWYRLWSKEFPGEALATTDGYEGTARYFETVAEAVAMTGCQSSDAQLRDYILKVIDREVRPRAPWTALDAEGYSIGGIASFILRLIHQDKNWFSTVSQGPTPVEILLDPVAPITDVVDATIATAYEKSISEMNTEISKLIDADLELLKVPSTVYVVLPHEAGQGAYSPRGFFQSEKMPSVTLVPLASASVYKTASWQTVADPGAVLMMSSESACSIGFEIAVKPEHLRIENGVATFTAPLLKGTMKGGEKVGHNGHRYFCGELN
jgi:hypothetical protein